MAKNSRRRACWDEGEGEVKEALEGKFTLTLGIRPENIGVMRAEGAPAEGKLVAETSAAELLGAEDDLHFELFGRNFIVKAPAQGNYAVGDKLLVTLCEENVIVFDPVTGDRIN